MNEKNTYDPQSEGTGYTPPADRQDQQNINSKDTPNSNTGESVRASKVSDEQRPSAQPNTQPSAQQGAQSNQGVPPPPKPEDEVGIRTMNDDVSSVESSGGSVGEPKTFRPKDLLKKEPGGSPPAGGAPPPNQQNQPEPRKNHTKMIILSVLGVLLLAGIAVAGYIYAPQFLGSSEPEPAPVIEPSVEFSVEPSSIQRGESAELVWNTTDADSVSIDEIGDVDLSGSMDITPTETTSYRLVASNSNEGTEVEATTTIEVVQPSDPFEHTSLFPESANVSQVSLSLSSISVESYHNSIKENIETETLQFAEVLPLFEGNAVNSYDLIFTFVPTLFEDYIRSTIAEDYTAFAYKDSNGIWPGFMVEINEDVDGSPVDFADLSNAIKQNPETFYVSLSPGSREADEFQEGALLSDNMTSIEFMPFAVDGASFNIATLEVENKTYLMWSTSFDGIKEAVSALGF